MAKTPIIYRRGLKRNLNTVPIKDGQLLITTDTGELYADITDERIMISNSTMVYFGDDEPTDQKIVFWIDTNEESPNVENPSWGSF